MSEWIEKRRELLNLIPQVLEKLDFPQDSIERILKVITEEENKRKWNMLNKIIELCKKINGSGFFVKNLKNHKYPVPKTCNVVYKDEEIKSKVTQGKELCDHCFPKANG